MKEISERDLNKIHDLITRIQIRTTRNEEDIRDLYNIVHVVVGTGVRIDEYKTRDTPYHIKEISS
jgi:hypothetical protein